MFIGSKPKDLFPRQNKAAADFYRRQQQKKIHAKGPYLVQRSFRRNEGTTDYATIPEITLSGDFSGSVEFSTSLTSGIGTLISGPVKNNSSLVLDVGVSAVRLLAYNSLGQLLPIAEVNGSFNDGAIHTAYFSLSGITAGLSIDNGSQITADWTASDVLKVSNLYRRQDDSNKLPGILANLKIYDNGTLIRDYPIDDNSDILRNRATVLGGELWNGVDAVAVGTEEVVATTIVGVDYLVTVSGLTSGEDLRYAGAGWLPLQDGVPFVITATSTAFILREFSESQSDITISIRRADGYGTVISGNADDWGLFQQQVTGEWLGQELLSQPFNPADWVVANAATYNGIVNNLHEYTFPASVSQDYVQQSVTNGLNYRATIDSQYISGIDSLRVKFGATRPFISPVSGINVVNELQNGTDFGFGAQSPDGPRTVGIKSISLKEVLNVA